MSNTVTENWDYYYTPGWQCLEERAGSVTTAERQFVWGLRYIDDLVIRDRSTANNGTMNERRYAMQDGNWNKQASTPTEKGGCSASALETVPPCFICDTTGSVGERYAYSAYGAPVFMTGAGTVQTSSPIGFETLYAGYRWDNPAPQMYYVRNRFLLPQVGTWNKRDPLGYVDGMGLSTVYGTINGIDPYGTDDAIDRYKGCPEKKREAITNAKQGLVYSCKCGWIDWGHAGGADEKSKERPGSGLAELIEFIGKIRELAKQPRGKYGNVCYGTSQQKMGIVSGTRVCFNVSTGLSEKEIECAAFQMFEIVQERFEYHQHEFEGYQTLFSLGTMPGNDSGFSPEDLPSDLIMFRRALNGFTAEDILRFCGPVITDVKVLLVLCSTFDWSKKNRTWDPVPCTVAAGLCEGTGESGALSMPKNLAAPRCDPSGEGVTWRRTGRESTGVFP